MNKERAIELQKKMTHKKLFKDLIHNCFRLIDPWELYEYRDEEGRWHKRQNVESLIPA